MKLSEARSLETSTLSARVSVRKGLILDQEARAQVLRMAQHNVKRLHTETIICDSCGSSLDELERVNLQCNACDPFM